MLSDTCKCPITRKKIIISKSSNHENCKNVDQYTSVSFLFCLPSYGLKGIPSFLFCKLYVHKHMNMGNSPLVYCIWPEMGNKIYKLYPIFKLFRLRYHFILPILLQIRIYYILLLVIASSWQTKKFSFIIAPFLKTYFVKENPRG